MILPRRLMTYTGKDGRIGFCEADDVRQDMNFHGPGFMIPDAEAERIGLKAYLDETGYGDVAVVKGEPEPEPEPEPKPEAKMVAQAEVEDKGVKGPEAKSPDELDAPKPDAMTDMQDDQKAEPEHGPGLHIDPALRRGGRRAT